jgi:DNA-binding response OmpR family regulator
MSGPEVARRLHESRPDLKVLFMSGFSTEVVVVHGLTEGDPLLVKTVQPRDARPEGARRARLSLAVLTSAAASAE